MRFKLSHAGPEDIDLLVAHRLNMWRDIHPEVGARIDESEHLTREWVKRELAEGQRLHYNFVKPHQALDGHTPAQVAGVGVQGDKWLELLRASLANQNATGGQTN